MALIAASSTSLGTNMSSSVGKFLLGHCTVTALTLPNSISRISKLVLFLHSISNALFAKILYFLTPSFSAFGSTASFIRLFASWDEVFESAA